MLYNYAQTGQNPAPNPERKEMLMYSSAYVWAKVLGHMENRLTAPVVSTWFDDAEVV